MAFFLLLLLLIGCGAVTNDIEVEHDVTEPPPEVIELKSPEIIVEDDCPENNDGETLPARFTARMFDNVWESANMEHSRFQTVEDFNSQADYYISVISEFVLRENWYEQYSDTPSIEFLLRDRISHVAEQGNRIYVNLNKAGFEHDLAPIAHEITHVIVKSSHDRTVSLDEGLASFMQERFGKNPTVHTWGIDAHMLAKMFFINYEDDYSSVFSVIGSGDSQEDRYMSGEFHLRQIFYVLSHSFTKYLIETYGIDDFMKLHASRDDLLDDYHVLYGKSYEEIKSEWHSVVESSPGMTLEEYDNHLEELFDRHNWPFGS